MNKPLAAISLDLDNQWSYMKTHGDQGWKTYPSYLEILIPESLEFCDKHDLKITFFIVGQDAALVRNSKALADIKRYGHDIGNHSFRHEPWLHLYSRERIRSELELAEKVIKNTTGQDPIGFRGPGFSWSRDLFLVLKERGYLYDASKLPTWIGPLGRFYYFRQSDLTRKQRSHRKKLFGSFRDVFRPNKPHFLALGEGEALLEIPVTTMPFSRIPIHFTYLLYLARYSESLMLVYFETAIKLCRLTRTGLSFLLHPLDFLGAREVPELAFFPGMDIMKDRKLRLLSMVIRILKRNYSLVSLDTYARSLTDRNITVSIR